jgi:membrane-associated phospholipid phosphatase
MGQYLHISLLLVAVAAPQPAFAADEADWGTASSIARDGLVLAALGLPALKGDWQGDLQAAASMGSAGALTFGLKETFPETRPDLSDRKSFPSGHTSVSFAAAATLQNRYGWEVGIPAQIVAGFVGLARVQARKHHWHDVAVGAAIGEASGFLLTSKRSDRIRILPWGDTQAAGFTVASRF